ncbi:hypothetical protein TrRE_jg5944 [Triparma retinervis]|uniref:Uncharacterized protein n=1 Tax=Triparma retinervis TaxID=2557542 RepID=A0A9W7KTN3_9STRA|nr:hypothetical protein TrRE_jg5944 [Triparma retinervis]
MDDAIDVDSMPQEVSDQLVHIRKLGPMADGFIAELNELYNVLVWSNEQAMDTERKIEEIYGEIHFSREQVVASNRVEEEVRKMKGCNCLGGSGAGWGVGWGGVG